ncbi:MAG TPA: DUF4091 domain-containing protein [Bacteroidales bacterium]|nr:DUF4091 domain-containing protein [Bacteroidales bacterium]
MKKAFCLIIGALYLLQLSSAIGTEKVQKWHYPLYLSNMDYWHNRIPVVVVNTTDNDASGETLILKIGKGKGQLPLEGENASELRVVDSDGTEFLWRITTIEKRIVNEGPIPAGSEFFMPVTVKGGMSETYYVYFDNQAAWPSGSVLEEQRYAKKNAIGTDLQKENGFHVEINDIQTISLSTIKKNSEWTDDKRWDIRVPVKIFNFGESKPKTLPVYVKMEQIYLRLHNKSIRSAPMYGAWENGSCFRFENALMFESSIASATEQTIYAYFASREKEDKKNLSEEFNGWCSDKRNLLLKMQGEGEINTSGWKQDIAIEPGKSYMFGSAVMCNDRANAVSLNIQFKGGSEGVSGGQSASDKVSGTDGWKFISGIFTAPAGVSLATMSFNSEGNGTAQCKGILMMEVTEGYSGSMFFDQRDAGKLDNLTAWQANTVVKVFREDLPPDKIPPVRISAARNETEPLQLALRSPGEYRNLRIEVTAPVNSAGHKLDQLSVNIVGYVPIDYPSNYYEKKVPYWHLKYPTEPIGSDGWCGYWPDPLLPVKKFDLKANTTQPIWIEVTIPEGELKGDFTGHVRLFSDDSLIEEIPWTVHVWNFSLPLRNSFGALYDYRSVHRMPETGPALVNKDLKRSDLQNMHLSLMAKHRISSGGINPVPKIDFTNGKVNIDFTEYDKAASYYFDELRNPFAYLPVGIFYLFGWAFPPSEKFNEKPYPGEYPYAEADRSKLRPEYKKTYQDVLKTFWDHLKEKGWADRYILYLADEPHEADNNKGRSNDINIQMKALCDMIHEVDPGIPIYVSTWWYRPEWQGYIDVWGLGFNGEGDYGHYVTTEDMQNITRSGGRIWYTTDGNFCTETPYLALERLLPWFGHKYGAEAYEFWGVNWLTYNPFKYGWHSYIFESQAPGQESWKRYPNGDGYIIYPGNPIGYDGLVSSIRLKQVREGAEDYEYFLLLGELIKSSDPESQQVKDARAALQQATDLVNIPCAMGRYSTKILTSHGEVFRIREQVAESIEELINK